MTKVDYSAGYISDLNTLLLNNYELKEEIIKRIKWFRKKPSDSRLDDHILTGKLAGRCAFSITDDIRILYKWVGKNRVLFLAIGGHGKVYGRDV